MGVVMQALKQGFKERNLIMASEADRLAQYWQNRLLSECEQESPATRESIVRWLLGSDEARYDCLNSKELDIAQQAMEYRYRILCQRYLRVGRDKAYGNLIKRLANLVTLRHKIQTWVSLSRDRQRTVLDVLQEVIPELLQSDSYMQQQMKLIAECTNDVKLHDALLFASTEEYCLRPVRNQPLLLYRFVNYLRRTQRGGLTQVPSNDLVRLVSEEVLTDDSDNRVSLLDNQAINEYQEAIELEQQQAMRTEVKQEFESYLQDNLGQEAVEWLRLYLQGKSQDAIAKKLGKPIKDVYRLREKISYHAVRVFALKGKPELIEHWLGTTLEEHNLGLTQKQLQELYQKLTPIQRQILDGKKAGKTTEVIATELKLKTHQVIGEWAKIYLEAQAMRTAV